MAELSSTAQSILTLLNNVNELIVESSNRQDAREVIKAMSLYAEEKRFDLPEDKIQNFLEVLIDSKPYTLTTLLMDIAEDVVTADRSS
jgi:hypothetical protein